MPPSPVSLKHWFAAAGTLLAVGLFVYWPSMHGGFIWDDELNIPGNELVRAADGLYRMWFTTEPFDYWPVTNSSYWIEWRLWGPDPFGYHLTNVLLHVANALLAWAALRRLSIPGAFIAALLFLVHPVNVESVAWITQRKNTLSTFFFMISLLLYMRQDSATATTSHSRTPPSARTNSWKQQAVQERAPLIGRNGWLLFSVLAFTFAMLSKGSVVVLPGLLLLLAWWKRDRITPEDALRVSPFVVIGAGLTLVNIWFQTHGGEIIRQATFVERALGAGGIVWFYLYKALVPLDLSFIYPQWRIDASDPRWWLPVGAAVAVTVSLLWLRRRSWARPLLFAWGFFCLALVPVMGFTDVYFMKFSLVADHYQYLALLGVCAAIAAGLETSFGMARGER